MPGIDYGRRTANINVKKLPFITTSKADGRVTQLKQQTLISSPQGPSI